MILDDNIALACCSLDDIYVKEKIVESEFKVLIVCYILIILPRIPCVVLGNIHASITRFLTIQNQAQWLNTPYSLMFMAQLTNVTEWSDFRGLVPSVESTMVSEIESNTVLIGRLVLMGLPFISSTIEI